MLVSQLVQATAKRRHAGVMSVMPRHDKLLRFVVARVFGPVMNGRGRAGALEGAVGGLGSMVRGLLALRVD
jgi:hypothetical protein